MANNYDSRGTFCAASSSIPGVSFNIEAFWALRLGVQSWDQIDGLQGDLMALLKTDCDVARCGNPGRNKQVHILRDFFVIFILLGRRLFDKYDHRSCCSCCYGGLVDVRGVLSCRSPQGHLRVLPSRRSNSIARPSKDWRLKRKNALNMPTIFSNLSHFRSPWPFKLSRWNGSRRSWMSWSDNWKKNRLFILQL